MSVRIGSFQRSSETPASPPGVGKRKQRFGGRTTSPRDHRADVSIPGGVVARPRRIPERIAERRVGIPEEHGCLREAAEYDRHEGMHADESEAPA